MIFLGTIKRIVGLWFRKNQQDVKILPNGDSTYVGTTTIELPPIYSGSTTLVGDDVAQTLTNKTIDIGSNTVSGITNTNISSDAGITATKLGNGDVDNTELSYLNGVTSSIQTQLNAKESSANKGQANGYASLDGSGRIPSAQLPASALEYKGTWNGATNSPTLADGTGDTGDIYIVSTGGTQNLGSGSITFSAGDWVVYNGSVWQKSINSNAVASVNGYTGVVSLTSSDISEGTNLYFTTGKVDTQFATYKYSTDWTSGMTKQVTHSLGTKAVSVTMYDNTSFEEVMVDSIVHTDNNNIDLSATQAPSGSGWKVIISKL